jgi:hypothetical protein
MSDPRSHFYRDGPKLGHVTVSRHAQRQIDEKGISQAAFEKALLTPGKPDMRESADIIWR